MQEKIQNFLKRKVRKAHLSYFSFLSSQILYDSVQKKKRVPSDLMGSTSDSKPPSILGVMIAT